MRNEETEDADGTETNVRLADGASVFGIDVSKWNKEIDWQKVKAAGEKQCGKTCVCGIIPAFAGFVDFVAVFAVECIFYGNQFML